MNFEKLNDGLVLVLTVLIGLSVACARPRIDGKHVLEDGSQLPAPHLILVRDYDVSADAVKLDSSIGSKAARAASGEDSVAQQSKLGKWIAESISEHLSLIFRSRVLQRNGAPVNSRKPEALSW